MNNDFQGQQALDLASTACFTGHRPERLPDVFLYEAYRDKLKAMLRENIIEAAQRGCDTFLCGMQRGLDIWAAKETIQVRDTLFPKIRLICVSPFSSEIRSRRGADKIDYNIVKGYSDGYIALNEEYHRGCFFERNRFMVDHSSLLIGAVYDYKSGTGQTITYARSKGLEIKLIDINMLSKEPL